MRVVFDANVIVAGVCWQGDGWLCLIRMARRQAFACGTVATLEETRETAVRVIRERQPPHNAVAPLDWYLDKVRRVEPLPLGKRRSRDVRDDPYLAAALVSKAQVIVTYDHDWLNLGRPFGISIVRPARFLARFHGGQNGPQILATYGFLNRKKRGSHRGLTMAIECGDARHGMSITVQLDLPESVAAEVRAKGLLEPQRVAGLIARELSAGSDQRDCFEIIRAIRAEPGEALTPNEIQSEVDVVRTERRACEARRCH